MDLKIIVKIPIYHSLESGKGKLRSTGRTKLSKQKFMLQITMEIMYIFIRKKIVACDYTIFRYTKNGIMIH